MTATNPRARVAVVGVTGYTGFELARILLRHPRLETPVFYLRDASIRCITELFPQLRGVAEAPCRPLSVEAVTASGADLVFLSTPHEASLELVPEFASAGMRVVDLSGAFRFNDPETFADWYKLPPAAKPLLDGAVYGLPELYANILRTAKVVANPGCYPTSAILALRPLVEAGWVDTARGIVCDSKSGVTGAGKEPKRETHFVEVDENFRAYGLFTHRHTPEITGHSGLAPEDFIFSTHLLPIARGILSTISLWLAEPREDAEIEAVYRKFYAGRPMVRIWPAGKLPEIAHVAGTNFCDIGFARAPDRRRLIVISCLDNLGKGAAGQAVQNLNWMLGYAETEALI